MNAIDHFREGERLLAEAKRTPVAELYDASIPANALLVAQARAHFEAAQTLLTALNSLNVPADDYRAWQEIGLAPRKPAGVAARDFELDDDQEVAGRG